LISESYSYRRDFMCIILVYSYKDVLIKIDILEKLSYNVLHENKHLNNSAG